MTQLRAYSQEEYRQVKSSIGDTLGSFLPTQEKQTFHSEGPEGTSHQNIRKQEKKTEPK